tara:strand:- start:2517 stop:2879 length:363 start_codon:yes stop_codon:yes gene_type:complete
MGKLLDKYTQPKKTVEFKFPLSGDTLNFHRPTVGEMRSVAEFTQSLEGVTDADVKISAKVLKTLCNELSEESETMISKDIEKLEAPDRGAIIPFYMELLGMDRDQLLRAGMENLAQTTKK